MLIKTVTANFTTGCQAYCSKHFASTHLLNTNSPQPSEKQTLIAFIFKDKETEDSIERLNNLPQVTALRNGKDMICRLFPGSVLLTPMLYALQYVFML